MPEVPASILFLGDHSPYGLSVARAILGSSLPLRSVIVPSEKAWSRIAARAPARRAGPDATRLIRRALSASRRVLEGRAPDIPGGEPIAPLALDPGTTAEALESSCRSAGIDWRRVDDVRCPDRIVPMHGTAGGAALFLSAAFPMILPESLLAVPALGSINFHPSLLPRCRGCHPIFWTLASGETQGGVSAHFMTPEIDGGNIVAQIPLPLSDLDDYASLYRRSMDASPKLVAMVETFLAAGGGRGIPQDPERATYFQEDTEEDHHVHWAGRSPHEVVALARTGEAFTIVRGERLGILKAAEVHTVAKERRRAAPGWVLAVNDDALVVEASGGAVALRSLGWRGRRHHGGDLARGLGLRRGEVLG